MAIQREKYKGKEILVANFYECKDGDEMITEAEKLADEVIKSNGGLLILSNYEGAFITPQFMSRVKELGKATKGKVKKSAVVGVHGVKRILLNGYNVATNRNMVAFSNVQSALEYLAKD